MHVTMFPDKIKTVYDDRDKDWPLCITVNDGDGVVIVFLGSSQINEFVADQ